MALRATVLVHQMYYLQQQSTSCISLYFMRSDQHVKCRIRRGFPLTSSLLVDWLVYFVTSIRYAARLSVYTVI